MGQLTFSVPGAQAMGDENWIVNEENGLPVIDKAGQIIDVELVGPDDSISSKVWEYAAAVEKPVEALAIAGAAHRAIEKAEESSPVDWPGFESLWQIALVQATGDWGALAAALKDFFEQIPANARPVVHSLFWSEVLEGTRRAAGDHTVREGYAEARIIAKAGSGEVTVPSGSQADGLDWLWLVGRLMALIAA